ncbi:MAG TPA: hypothetical protein VFH74_10315 [Gaiellales bacterium]|nr:hypothetical protein [Gaiellales bacterium]
MQEQRRPPGFVVFRQEGDDFWRLIGEVPRTPGLTARRARAKAVADATGGRAAPGATYAAVLRSEWRVSLDL